MRTHPGFSIFELSAIFSARGQSFALDRRPKARLASFAQALASSSSTQFEQRMNWAKGIPTHNTKPSISGGIYHISAIIM